MNLIPEGGDHLNLYFLDGVTLQELCIIILLKKRFVEMENENRLKRAVRERL